MNHSTEARLPLFRHLLPSTLIALLLMGLCDWLIATRLPQDAQVLGSLVRMLLATVLVGASGYLLYHRQRHLGNSLTSRLQGMLTHQETLNEHYQRELREREASELALTNQLQFLQILIDAIPAPIFYKNAEGVYTGCNRAFETFLGKRRDQIVGRSVYGISPDPQARIYHEKDIELMRQRGRQVYESQVVYADGTLHDVIFNKASYEMEDGHPGGLIGVILDITERKTLERELVQAKEKAEFYSRSKTQFLTNMSHEIRTPLNAIVGFSQVLLHRSPGFELPQSFQDILEKIAISGQGLAKLVNDVLDISRIEAGKIETEDEDFQLHGLVKCILVTCEPQAELRALRIHCEIDPDLPEFIRLDRGKLSQILINLAGNAIKFSPADSAIEIKLGKLKDDRFLLEVIDQGIGIPPEQQAIIFEPFEQVDKSSSGQSRGSGLGLPITRSLVKLLGGEISLESKEGAGTRFRVLLPLREGTPTESLPTDNNESLEALRGTRVLIFEDNTLNQALMQAFCDDLEAHVTFVSDGRDGLAKTAELRPDIIFMDIHLPGQGGIEITQQIRQHAETRHIPIIGLSAVAFSEQRNAALKAGMNDYLTKPVAFQQLISAMQKHRLLHPATHSLT